MTDGAWSQEAGGASPAPTALLLAPSPLTGEGWGEGVVVRSRCGGVLFRRFFASAQDDSIIGFVGNHRPHAVEAGWSTTIGPFP